MWAENLWEWKGWGERVAKFGMGPWFLNTLWFTSMAALAMPENVEPGWKGEDPSFKEVVPTSASSEACWKTKVLPRASEDQWFPPSMQTARGWPDWDAVPRGPVSGMGAGQTSPPSAGRSGDAVHGVNPKPSPAEQQQHPQFKQAGRRESKNRQQEESPTRAKGQEDSQNPDMSTTPSTKQLYHSFPRYLVRTSRVPGTAPTTGDFKSKQRIQTCSCGTRDGRWRWRWGVRVSGGKQSQKQMNSLVYCSQPVMWPTPKAPGKESVLLPPEEGVNENNQ